MPTDPVTITLGPAIGKHHPNSLIITYIAARARVEATYFLPGLNLYPPKQKFIPLEVRCPNPPGLRDSVGKRPLNS